MIASPTSSTGDLQRSRAAALPPEERRAAIIAATEPLLADIGQQVTTRAIAEAAGVAEGTIFRVFSDKDELLAATFSAVLDRDSVTPAIEAIDPDLPFVDRLVAAVDTVRERILYVWRLHANLSPELRSHSARPMQISPALVEMIATEPDRFSVSPTDAALLLQSFTFACAHPLLSPEPRSADDIVRLLIEGIGSR